MIKLFHALAASIHRPSARWASLCMLTLATLGSGHAASAQELRIADPKAGDAILIMDYSNSMWGQINGVPKVEIARNIIDANFGNWNRLTNLGLMPYGHRYKNDCADIQLISPPGELDTSIVDRFLAQAQPKGRTPLASSIEQAASYFIANGKKANIILLTDGIESCDRDPCATIGALQDAGLNMTAHVIGFGVTEEEGSQLSCIASITGGEYLTAANATSLDDAFQEAIDLVRLNDEIRDLQGMIGQLRGTLSASQQEIIGLAAENSSLVARGNDLQNQLLQTQGMKDDLTNRYGQLQNQAADLEVRNSQLQVIRSELQAQNGELLNDNAQLRQDLSQQTSRLAATEALLDETQDMLRSTKDALTSTSNSLLEAEKLQLATDGELVKTKKALNETQKSLLDTEKKLLSTEMALLDTENDLLSTRNELRATRDDLKNTRTLLAETQDDRDRKVQLIGNLREEIDGLRDDLSASSIANLELTQMNGNLMQENASLRAAIDRMLNVLTDGNEALKSAFSIGNTVTMDVNEKAVMSEMSVDSDATPSSGEKDSVTAPSANQ